LRDCKGRSEATTVINAGDKTVVRPQSKFEAELIACAEQLFVRGRQQGYLTPGAILQRFPRSTPSRTRSCSKIKLPPAAARALLRGGSGALGCPGLPESLPEQPISSGSNALTGRARGRRPV